jgi:hypothetical protein
MNIDPQGPVRGGGRGRGCSGVRRTPSPSLAFRNPCSVGTLVVRSESLSDEVMACTEMRSPVHTAWP